jgi:phosphomethylpyrimidine synthase
MCGPHFCSMRITQDVRDYAAAHGLAEDEALAAGLREKAEAFHAGGQSLYVAPDADAPVGGE